MTVESMFASRDRYKVESSFVSEMGKQKFDEDTNNIYDFFCVTLNISNLKCIGPADPARYS